MFSDIIAHMVKGIMFHAQMADYFGFLGMYGFRAEQERHFCMESALYRQVSAYLIDRYNKLPEEREVENPKVIPESWHKYMRQDVDAQTKLRAINEALDWWVEWETQTKDLYERNVKELYDAGYIAGSIAVERLVSDVSEELRNAEQERMDVSVMGLPDIINLQGVLYDKYRGSK